MPKLGSMPTMGILIHKNIPKYDKMYKYNIVILYSCVHFIFYILHAKQKKMRTFAIKIDK